MISQTSNLAFAELLGVTPEQMSKVCYASYFCWLLREIYMYADISVDRKEFIVNCFYSLLHDQIRVRKALDHILIGSSNLFVGWLQMYHEQYYKRSPHYRKNTYGN